MARTAPNDKPKRPPLPPAATEKARTNQLVSLARDVSEERLRNGTASAQELVHFLKAGSPTAKLERQILEKQKELLVAKTSAIESQKRVEELYANALSAMRAYSGEPEKESEYDDD